MGYSTHSVRALGGFLRSESGESGNAWKESGSKLSTILASATLAAMVSYLLFFNYNHAVFYVFVAAIFSPAPVMFFSGVRVCGFFIAVWKTLVTTALSCISGIYISGIVAEMLNVDSYNGNHEWDGIYLIVASAYTVVLFVHDAYKKKG